jgi:hypothetical protein
MPVSTKKKKETKAERNIRWIEKHCRIPEGKDVGKPVRLRDFQKKIIKRIATNVIRAVMSPLDRLTPLTSEKKPPS